MVDAPAAVGCPIRELSSRLPSPEEGEQSELRARGWVSKLSFVSPRSLSGEPKSCPVSIEEYIERVRIVGQALFSAPDREDFSIIPSWIIRWSLPANFFPSDTAAKSIGWGNGDGLPALTRRRRVELEIPPTLTPLRR